MALLSDEKGVAIEAISNSRIAIVCDERFNKRFID
jgi:hypothetical protein